MFALVDEVEHYPLFLPWCAAAEVHHRSKAETVAALHIDYHGAKTSFTTRNRKDPPQWMHIGLESGPFRHLAGHWRFKPLGERACKVEFRLEYEFSNRILDKLVGPVFHHIASTLVEAFIARADELNPPP